MLIFGKLNGDSGLKILTIFDMCSCIWFVKNQEGFFDVHIHQDRPLNTD